MVLIDLLLGYIALAMYIGFWVAIRMITDEIPASDKLLRIWIAMVIMPVAIPLGIVVGIYRMMTGVTLVLFVDEERDGMVTQTRVVIPNRRT